MNPHGHRFPPVLRTSIIWLHTPLEREMAGQKQLIVSIIRAANKKSFREIHHQIRAAQVKTVEQAWQGLKGQPISVKAEESCFYRCRNQLQHARDFAL